MLASDVDVIVESVGGLDPAGTWARRAIEAGKSVVTANKKLIAYHGIELERLAAARGGHLKYGAAVAGGIPVIPGLEQGLAGDHIAAYARDLERHMQFHSEQDVGGSRVRGGAGRGADKGLCRGGSD